MLHEILPIAFDDGKAGAIKGTPGSLRILPISKRFPHVLSAEKLMSACYNGRDDPSVKIVEVLICKIRKKIAPLGVRIDNVWGSGYVLAVQCKIVTEDAA